MIDKIYTNIKTLPKKPSKKYTIVSITGALTGAAVSCIPTNALPDINVTKNKLVYAKRLKPSRPFLFALIGAFVAVGVTKLFDGLKRKKQ